MGLWTAKPMVKLAMAGEESVPPEPCVKIKVGDNIDVDIGAFFLFTAMTCCVMLEGSGVLDFLDNVSVGAERTQDIGLGEKGRSKWCCCDILEWPFRFPTVNIPMLVNLMGTTLHRSSQTENYV